MGEKIKKIGLLTWYDREENCGQTLQALALQYSLTKALDHVKCVIINYKYGYRSIWLHKVIWPFYYLYDLLRRKQVRRWMVFHHFIRKYMTCSKRMFLKKEVERYLEKEKIRALILGSDQIWNPQSGKIPDVMRLDFAQDVIKTAYSPSMCASELAEKYEEEIKQLADSIETFSYVGVRENSAKNMLIKYSDKDIHILLDPVFLLDKDEWLKFANKQYCPSGKYILVYCVGNISENTKTTISKIMLEKKINKVLGMKTNKNQIYPDSWEVLSAIGPAEFLALTASAEYIICDSFHMTAFSIIFEKNFYVFPAIKKGYKPNPERFTELLDQFGLSERFSEGEPDITDIDYSKYNRQIIGKINQSKDELKKICNLLLNDDI